MVPIHISKDPPNKAPISSRNQIFPQVFNPQMETGSGIVQNERITP